MTIDPLSVVALTNAELSRLLGAGAAEASGHLAQALRRASRRALEWPEEAAALHAAGRSLTELSGIGPVLADMLARWIEDPQAEPVPEPDPLRSRFLTLAEVRSALAGAPGLHHPKGDLQMHTTWSDGGTSIEEMAAAARERGYDYLAITDHSKTLKIAGGMDEETLAAQGTEIERIQEEVGPPAILRSVELNLDVEGRGDMDPAALARLDLVLGSFHSALRLTSDQTERYLAAVRNPDLHILGHPRGRMYGRRAGLTADWDRVFAEAARLGRAVEVDAFPDRQDLEVGLLRRACEAGALVSIGSDAHHPSQLRYLEYGLGAAALAGIPPHRILNFWSAAELRSWAAALRAGAGADAPVPRP